VQEALARVSATMMRALLRIQANEARGAAGAEHPSGPGAHTPSS
jgi:hypothetical protein